MKELVYKINGVPTPEKIEEYDEDNNIFYRFQNPTHEMGEKSWGMIYSSEEEALEDGSTILDGKSCCWTVSQLLDFAPYFDNDYVVLVVNGYYVEDGHDDEPVVDIAEVLEVWNLPDLVKAYEEYTEE